MVKTGPKGNRERELSFLGQRGPRERQRVFVSEHMADGLRKKGEKMKTVKVV